MCSAPETRPSLLVRVRDPADRAAWQEFVEIYRPVILRIARQKGMQAADAEDVAAEVVLAAVAKAIERRNTTRSGRNSAPGCIAWPTTPSSTP